MRLPENVEFIISRLNAAGHRADIVGGCVRDSILGKKPNDYDITTDATPNEMREIFADMRTVDTGIKHGTLTVLVGGEPYEITTYRLDGEYSDNRHPDRVMFTRRLEDDLSRRDFTVNAMCYNMTDGFTDLFSGREDIEGRIIRAVGDPVRRFTEDALRILRALRFASTLDFYIEKETSAAIFKTAHLLRYVSCERIYTEWKKLISGVGAYRVISEYKPIIRLIMPTLSDIVLPKEALFNSASAELRELSLFANQKEPADAFSAEMSALRCDNRHKSYGVCVLENMNAETDTEIELKLLLVKVGEECTRGVLRLKILLGSADEAQYDLLDSLLKRGVCYRLADMKVDGNDIAALGIRGKKIGETLNELLRMIARGEVMNEREELLSAVTK